MKRIKIGQPFNTDAVVDYRNISEGSVESLPSFLHLSIKGSFSLSYLLGKRDIVYGLGENVRGINKRGGIYESFCTDEFDHTPDKRSIYAAHNFIVVDGREHFGIFIDHPGRVTFDIGHTDMDRLLINAEEANLNLLYIEGDSTIDIVHKFRKIIGLSYIPPKWAFGFQQSRWSYPDNKAILAVAEELSSSDIPCDAIYLDIDYMDNFKNFTIDQEKFPDFNKFVGDIKDKGYRLIPIIDAGCKVEKGYSVCDEGVDNGYFCVDSNGKPFVGAVWPGKVHFPDFLNSKARKWFGDKYKFLVDSGIEGFWNDMNEPAIFYSEEGLKKAFDKVESVKDTNLDIYSFFNLKDTFNAVSNSEDDYKSFFHNVNGKLVNHYSVHNLYGYNMTRAAGESLEELYSNKRFLLFSRASYVGMHRYGGIWTGDNKSWWEHLLLNIKMMPSLNMVGFLYSGADIGGFGCDSDPELVLRWTQFGIFTPLFRNHGALGTRVQEPYSFSEDVKGIMRRAIQFRYALIPYIYSEFMKAALESELYFRPLGFEYYDDESKRVETQLLVGESLMVAPIHDANSFGRTVYLPDDMLLWMVDDYRVHNLKIIKKGHSYIPTELNQIPLFIRKNRVLVLGNHGKNVESIDNREISVIAFVKDRAEYNLYDDDGTSKEYLSGKNSLLSIVISIDSKDKLDISASKVGSSPVKIINYTVISAKGERYNGQITV